MKRASVLLLSKEFRPLRHWSERSAKSRPHLGKISSSLSYSVQLISGSTALGNTGVWRHRSRYLTQLFSSTNKGSLQIKASPTLAENLAARARECRLMEECAHVLLTMATKELLEVDKSSVTSGFVFMCAWCIFIHPKHNPILIHQVDNIMCV